MRRKDLRVECENRDLFVEHGSHRPVSDAELAELIESMGYVRRPVCGECDGTGCYPAKAKTHTTNGKTTRSPSPHCDTPCPSCGGTGFDGYSGEATS